MKKITLALFILSSITFAQIPAGFVQTSFFGTPVVQMDLPLYMQNWSNAVENQSILSLDAQGTNSPAALANEAAAVAANFCAATVYAPVPGCATAAATSAIVTPIQQAIEIAANTVPVGQWVATSYQPQLCSTLALCLVLSSATPPPAPVAGPLVLLPCSQVGAVAMCYPGSGVTNVTATGFAYNGGTYVNGATIEFSGVSYQAHTSQGLIGASVWFSPTT